MLRKQPLRVNDVLLIFLFPYSFFPFPFSLVVKNLNAQKSLLLCALGVSSVLRALRGILSFSGRWDKKRKGASIHHPKHLSETLICFQAEM